MRRCLVLGSVLVLLLVVPASAPAAGASPSGDHAAFKGSGPIGSEADAQALPADPRVANVGQEPVRAEPQMLPTGIDRVDGELSSTVSGDGSGSVDVDVAVIDTGIDLHHPDLNVVGGVDCSSGRPKKRGFNDRDGHGTHVAGIIGAIDNGFGVVGVAPGARLWAVRVATNHDASFSDNVVCGVDWVTRTRTDSDPSNDIEVANISTQFPGTKPPPELGCTTGTGPIERLHDAICTSVNLGVTYTVSAGNRHSDAAGQVPAAFDEVITVSALADFDGRLGGLASPTCTTDGDDTFANTSNFGADVDLIAPGLCIHSTSNLRGGYSIWAPGGTSQASPHAAGAAALYKAAHPDAMPPEVKSALQQAGTYDWNNGEDPDGIQEPLVNVGTSPRCHGQVATIVGSDGDDPLLLGTEGPDVIQARGGTDIVQGRGGNDVICGGDGPDLLFGLAGDDALYSEGGGGTIGGFESELHGGDGDDTLVGGAGPDSLIDDDILGTGNDTLHGMGGDDALSGSRGVDVLFGELGDDFLSGGDGGDQLFGGDGDDFLTGQGHGVNDQDDKDLIDGGIGADEIFGGGDNDDLNAVDGVFGNDSVDGGTGVDQCSADISTTPPDPPSDTVINCP